MKGVLFIATLLLTTMQVTAQRTVNISGRVTDLDGNPRPGTTVMWFSPDFNIIAQTQADSTGYYFAEIEKGNYMAMAAVDMELYPFPGSKVAESGQMLEYWAWNFIADRDRTLDVRYHRLEMYGLTVFQVPGAVRGFTIYLRPMSLSKYHSGVASCKPAYADLVPDIENSSVTVCINDREYPVRMKQQVKEYFAEEEYGDAWLLFVDRPGPDVGRRYDVIKVVVEDLESGDRGEAVYFYEYPEFVK